MSNIKEMVAREEQQKNIDLDFQYQEIKMVEELNEKNKRK